MTDTASTRGCIVQTKAHGEIKAVQNLHAEPT